MVQKGTVQLDWTWFLHASFFPAVSPHSAQISSLSLQRVWSCGDKEETHNFIGYVCLSHYINLGDAFIQSDCQVRGIDDFRVVIAPNKFPTGF